jgi:hypothetical protein
MSEKKAAHEDIVGQLTSSKEQIAFMQVVQVAVQSLRIRKFSLCTHTHA